MLRIWTKHFWTNSLPLLFTPQGRAQLGGVYTPWLMRIWPRLRKPATLYRATFGKRTRVVAIVGSLGKSTTKYAVAAALNIPRRRVIEQNAYAFVAFAVFRTRPWRRHAVIEVGLNGPGEMATYTRIVRPDLVVVTSIASEHIRSFGSLEVTRAEKSKMVSALPPHGLAVLNGDDPNVLWMRDATRARVKTIGFGEANDIRASDVALDWPHGTRFRLHVGSHICEVSTKLVGGKFVYPILAAVAVGLEEGIPLEELLSRLAAVGPADERLQTVVASTGAIVLRDDYKSTLESVDAALDVLGEIPAKRKIVVMGDVDCREKSHEEHRRIGGRIGQIAQHAVFVGGDCQSFAAGAFRGGLARDAMTKAHQDLDRALAGLPTDLGPGDVILVKGRARQRLGRIALALLGRNVKCRIADCPLPLVRCHRCAMLEHGWQPPAATPGAARHEG